MRSVSTTSPSLPLPPPSEGLGEGSEAPSVVNVKEPRVSSPTSMPTREHEERGRDTPQVRGGEREASSTSLALGGGGGESSQPQPDTLEDKSPPSPSHLRLKISSYHHVDDWGEEGEDRVPSPAPSPLQAKRRREERERAPDFQEKSARCRSPTRECPQPHGHDRRAALARLRSPPLWALPAGDSRIHWGLIHPYDEQTEFGEHVSRPLDQTVHHNSVANSVWQRAEARNRSRAREPDTPSRSYPRPHHQVDTSDRPRSWAPQPRNSTTQPAPPDPYHRVPQLPRHMEPRDHRATRYDLDHPACDRRHEAQRPQASAAVQLGSHAFASKPRSYYQKRATPPTSRSRHPPVHTISDSDSLDAEARPQGSYSPRLPPRKSPR